MSFSPRFRAAGLIAAVAAACLLAVAPAAAEPIPEGTIFTTQWGGGQLYTSDPSSGALATVGAASGINWISGVDIDGVSGAGYAVTYVTDPVGDEQPGPSALYAVDASTGAITYLHDITRNGEPADGCLDLDYTGDEILVACDLDATASWIGSVDPSTGAATEIVPTMDRTQAIARLGDTLIAFGFEGVTNSVDLTTGAVTYLGLVEPGLYPAGADFNAAGVLYVSSRVSMDPFDLYIVDPVALTGDLIGPMGLDGVDVGAGEDLSVTGALPTQVVPTLASTGADASGIVCPALLALLAFAVGAVLVRRRRTA